MPMTMLEKSVSLYFKSSMQAIPATPCKSNQQDAYVTEVSSVISYQHILHFPLEDSNRLETLSHPEI